MYTSVAATIISTIFLSNRLGNRKTILLAMYLSIFFTILCAIVPNYWTLLVSRIMVGCCVGLNVHPVGVFLSQGASTRGVFVTGTWVWLLAYGIACVWVGVLAYLSLEQLDWRLFVLVTSLPAFIPPIFMLHLVFTEDFRRVDPDNRNLTVETQVQRDTLFWVNLFKVSAAYLLLEVLKYGGVLLAPNLIRAINEKEADFQSEDPCSYVVKGDQFLYLAAANMGLLLSSLLTYFIRDRVPFIWKHLLAALFCFTGYILLAVIPNNQTAAMVTAVAFVENLVIDAALCDLTLLQYDEQFFGTGNLNLASNVIGASAAIGYIIGSFFASFFSTQVAVIIFLFVCIFYALLMLSIEFKKLGCKCITQSIRYEQFS